MKLVKIPLRVMRYLFDAIISSALSVGFICVSGVSFHNIVFGVVLYVAVYLLCLDCVGPCVTEAIALKRDARILERHDYRESGIPADCRTAICISVVLLDERQIRRVVHNSEYNSLIANDSNAVTVLLTDFPDSSKKEATQRDGDLLGLIQSLMAELNLRHPTHKFLLLHRDHVWNTGQRCWMGWERKRGKIVNFVSYLGSDRRFNRLIVGSADDLTDIKYIMCLDEDSLLTPDALQELMGIMRHPACRPIYDESRKFVKAGYGAITPSLWTEASSASHWRFGQYATGRRARARGAQAPQRSVLFELHDSINFPGKGLIDVEVFRSVVASAFPENCILSHDTLEGALMRTAYAGAVSIIERFPNSYPSLLERRFRWTRGDFQNCWLMLFGGLFSKAQYGCNFRAQVWRLLSGQIRSALTPVCITAILISPLFVGERFNGSTLLAVFGLLLLPILIKLSLNIRIDRKVGFPTEHKRVAKFLYLSGVSQALNISLSLHLAMVTSDAALRSIIRVLRKQRLLDWKTMAAVEGHTTTQLGEIYLYCSGLLGFLLMAYAVIGLGSISLLVAGSLWAASPLLALHAMHGPQQTLIEH